MNNILCLGDFSSGKSSFLNMLLGVSILPEQLQSTNLPVIKIHSGETAGIYIREEGQKYGRPIASWTNVPEDWSTFEYVELTVPNHPLLDKGLVLWDSPGINSTNHQHIKHLEDFLKKNEDQFQSVLYFVHGNIQNTHLEFIRKWPKLQANMTVVVNIKEVLSKEDCRKIHNEVKNTVQSQFIQIPVELLYIGDLYDDFAEESEKKSSGYDDHQRIALWNKIAIDFDALKKKHQNSITGERIFELLKFETAAKYADGKERERLLQIVNEYWNDGKYSETVPALLKLADYEYPDIHYKLGRCFYDEYGVERDYNEAFKWFNKAAQNGSIYGQHYCGICYYYGDGVTQDYKKAGYCFLYPAKQGIASSQYHMALLFESGHGVNKDDSEALKWLQLSAEQGHSHAQFKLGDYYYFGKGVPKNYSETLKWFSKSAKAGNPKAYYELAEMYLKGSGVKKDIKQAKYYYKKALQSGDKSLKKIASDKLNSIRKSRNKKIAYVFAIAVFIVGLIVIINQSNSQDHNISLATYISASEESISFPSEGGSKTIYISTNGNKWDISWNTINWIKAYQEGNAIKIDCQRNTWNARTDYFVVKSDYREKRIYIYQSGIQATYISASEENISFPSEGGSKSVYISTNGTNWEFSYSTDDWITTSRDGNKITLNCQRNAGSERNDFFEVKSDYYTKRVYITQSAELTTPSAATSAAPSASIKNVWTDHNVWQGSDLGMMIHVKFYIENLQNKHCNCNAYFYLSDGTKLKDFNGQFKTRMGYVSAGEGFTPSYTNSNFGDFPIFMPYSELHMSQGTFKLKFHIELFDNNDNSLCTSDYFNFTYSNQ